MNTIKLAKPALSALAFSVFATNAFANGITYSTVNTHPSQGPEATVEEASARLVPTDDGAFVSLNTSGLKPGHVHTLWFVTIANPAACASSPCTGKDVLKNTDAVEGDAGFAGGVVADESGAARFSHFQETGPLINGWFGRGLGDIATTEIHLVIKDHGPIIEGRLDQMLTTFRDACRTDSINPAFPDVAFADGEAGPNTCALVQYTAFLAQAPAS
jgi:hypothetical protein